MPLWTFQAWVVMAAYGQLPNIGYAARRRSLKSILKQELWQWLQFDFSFFLSLCSAWPQKHSFSPETLIFTNMLGVGTHLEVTWVRSCGQALQTIRSHSCESPKLEVNISSEYIYIHFRKKVQPYVPSTPVLYLGMDDDNGKKDDNNDNNNYDNDNNNR